MGKVRKAISVPLPVGSLGISIKGCPPVISKIYENSPVTEIVQEGYVVEKIVFEDDGTTISGMSKVSLAEILSKTKNVPNRVLICKERLTSNTKKLPPSVKLGVNFKGTPPTITAVAKDSCIRKKVKTGYVVQSLTVGKGGQQKEYTELTSRELADLLDAHFHEKNRTLYLDIPPPAYLAKVYLPSGPLGIAFKGSPPRITQVFEDSYLYGRVQVGSIVESITLADGTTYPQDMNPDPEETTILRTKHLITLLKETSHESGRMVRLTKPRRFKTEGPNGTKEGGTWMIQTYEGYMGESEERFVYQEPYSASRRNLNNPNIPVLLYDENGFLVKPGNTRPIPNDMARHMSGGQMVSSRNLRRKGSIKASSMRDFSMGESSRRSLGEDSSSQFLMDDSSASHHMNHSSSGRRSTSVGRPSNSSGRSMQHNSSRSVGPENREKEPKKSSGVAISLW